MIQLKIYCNNTLGTSLTYVCNKLTFQSFYAGENRDNVDLRVIRRISEGNILVQDVDFDNLKPFFFSDQSAQLYLEGVWQWGIVSFRGMNYARRKVFIDFKFTDEYSLGYDGIINNGWNLEAQVPNIDKKFTVEEIKAYTGTLPNYYVDGSQYLYDPTGVLWYLENSTAEGIVSVEQDDILKFNSGGLIEAEDLMFVPDYLYGKFYKPLNLLYTNPLGTTYRYLEQVFVREVRWFPNGEVVPEDWNSLNSTKTYNGIVYWKYARFYGGIEQTYFSQLNVYFIRNDHASTSEMEVKYEGVDTSIQNSENFFELNELLENLTKTVFENDYSFDSVLASRYIASMRSYNSTEDLEAVSFHFRDIVSYLRDNLAIFFSINNGIISFKLLSTGSILLDLKTYRDKDWTLNMPVSFINSSNVYIYESLSEKLDFKTRRIDFFGLKEEPTTISNRIQTDCELIDESPENYILIQPTVASQSVISESWVGIDQTDDFMSIAFKLGVNGSWFSGAFPGGNVELNSPDIFLNGFFSIFYIIELSVAETVIVSVGNYTATHTAPISTAISSSGFYEGKTVVRFRISGNTNLILKNFQIMTGVRQPKKVVGLITGLSKKNNDLSIPKIIVDKKPFMSYPRGTMEDYGVIECEPKYAKEINLVIPLEGGIFGFNFDKYLKSDDEKYIVFEKKRQIISETEISKTDKVKARSNEIY